jgi:DNA-binding sugar fermentation-stimulating protein
MEKNPHVIIIAGTGRNTGKTSLACAIIRKFSKSYNLIGVKVSPHFHTYNSNSEPIFSSENFAIFNETKVDSGKDSSFMLKSGAKKVFYVEVKDAHLVDAYLYLTSIIPPSTPVVIESPGLRKILEPGLFIIVDHPQQVNKKKEILSLAKKADLFIDTSKEKIEELVKNLEYTTLNGWSYIKPDK